MSTFDKVKEVVIDKLGVEEDKIVSDASFVDDLGADSLDVVEMIMAIETEFSSDDEALEINDEEAEKIIKVSDALSFLENKGITD